MPNKLSHTLFRSLLRACMEHDKYPALKAHLFNPLKSSSYEDKRTSPMNDFLDQYAKIIYKHSNAYYYTPSVSFTSVVKHFFSLHKNLTGEVSKSFMVLTN
jgi:hypothetical protein